MPENFNDTLLKILEKEVEKEKWRMKFRKKGTIINKRLTKKGSIMLTIKSKAEEYDIVVPKHRRKEFETAKNLGKDDCVSVIGDKKIGVVFCERIKIISKEFLPKNQMKLIKY